MKAPLLLPAVIASLALGACDSQPPAETATPTPAAESTADHAGHEVREAADASLEAAREAAHEAADAARDLGEKAADAAKDAADKAEHLAEKAGDAAKDAAHDVKESMEDKKEPNPLP